MNNTQKQMFSNETIFKTIQEMVKQYENIKDEDEYREKAIDLVYNTFNIDRYQSETLFDIAMYNNWIYLTDTDSEIEFDIEYNGTQYCCYLHDNWHIWRDYYISYNFRDNTPVIKIMKTLDKIAKSIETINDKCSEHEEYRELLNLID